MTITTLFETTNQVDFLNELQRITAIDIRILDNLFKLDLICNIFKNKKSLQIGKNSFSIQRDICLKDDYLNTHEYFFASYPLHNPNFSVFPFDLKKHSYAFQKSLINYNSNDPVILVLNTYQVDFTTVHSFITISFNVDFNFFFQNDINKLNEEDKEQCKRYIELLIRNNVNFHHSGFVEFTLNSKDFLFLNSSIQLFLENFNHQNLDNYLTKNLDNYFKICNLIEHEEKEGINILFEQSLIKKEINNF